MDVEAEVTEEVEAVDDALLGQMYEAMRRHTREGDPVKAYALQGHIDNRTRPPAELLYFGQVKAKPEVLKGEAPPDMPPRVGKGASKEAWRVFAKNTSDLEHSIIDSMGRDDIVHALEAQKIIPYVADDDDDDFYAGY